MIRVCALYRFATFPDPAALREPLLAVAEAHGIRGTLLLANEGINGTIAGTQDGIEAVLDHIRTLPGCAELDYKDSTAETMPFHRMKVRLKREIVSMGVDGIDPTREVGTYVAGAAWNALIADPKTVVIDTRNDYEVAIGSFDGAVDPKTKSFRDFPDWFRANRDELLAGKTRGDVLHRGHTLRKGDRLPEGRGRGGCLPPRRRYPEIFGDDAGRGKPLAGRMLRLRCARGGRPWAGAGQSCTVPWLPDAGQPRGSHLVALCRGRELPRLPRHA